MANVTCIIAAYNEEGRIHNVLQAALACNDITQIIVVDDGSTDGTGSAVQQYPNIQLISLPENKGKSFAVATGLKHATGDIIAMLDADLLGITAESIHRLLAPVMSGQVDVTMSLRGHSILFYRLLGLDFITGERVFYKRLFSEYMDAMKALPSYGLEVFMNRVVINKRASLAIVSWSRVTSPRKIAKLGFFAGLKGDMETMRHVLSVIPLREVISQNLKLSMLTHRSSVHGRVANGA